MTRNLKLAIGCHVLASLVVAAFGLMYLLRTDFMPYHAVAVGQKWTDVAPGFQALILGLMKAAAGGWLASVVAIGILLAVPFREGLRWARWAIPAIGLTATLTALYATLYVGMHSPATPPWIAAAAAALLFAAGLVVSLVPEKANP